ncbi:hypothetical protein HELRODRAFT_175054 [Helobdella robusta]|uniref:Peptidase M13 N-terminal domain-containing protein n=1 Tax=Helobdella robusta TaxID=6412 RepID=T1F8S6_HELRO|nr:hypothetical protein HELRODRAFT_175054 [Helobdella robusta]ESO01029.1 hypothetical protein HELRODRAFT_175054 [Helobdella robusta]
MATAELLSSLDKTVNPCDDFYQYVCGKRMRMLTIPEDQNSFTIFGKLGDITIKKLNKLLEVENDSEVTSIKSAKVFYRSCLNESQFESEGIKPFLDLLASVGSCAFLNETWKEEEWLIERVLALTRVQLDINILLDTNVYPDDKNSTHNALGLDQDMLELQQEEYFGNSSKVRQSYETFLLKVMTKLKGEGDETKTNHTLLEVLEFEKKLSNVTGPLRDRMQPEYYKKITVGYLNNLTNHVSKFNWTKYFNTIQKDLGADDTEVITYSLDYIIALSELISKTDKKTLSNFIAWSIVRHFTRVTGLPGFQTIISDYRKAKSASDLIKRVREEFINLLKKNEWMDEETRQYAIMKAKAIVERIGYSDHVLNDTVLNNLFDGLVIKENKFLENLLNVKHFQAKAMFKSYGTIVSKDEWDQIPAQVNAYYDPTLNEISTKLEYSNDFSVFPASIFQPTFFSHIYPRSMNYGGIGMAIGHEIIHGFDNKALFKLILHLRDAELFVVCTYEGKCHDEKGNLKDWWDPSTEASFQERADCMINQYNQFEIKQLNLTAYQRWVKENGEEPSLPGLNFTHNQLLFVNYAQIWCELRRDEDALKRSKLSPHPPGEAR